MTSTDLATLDPAVTPDCAQSIAELLASRITGVDIVHGACVKLTATPGDDGWVTLEVRQVEFGGDDHTVRGHFRLTDLTPVPAVEVDVERTPPLDAA